MHTYQHLTANVALNGLLSVVTVQAMFVALQREGGALGVAHGSEALKRSVFSLFLSRRTTTGLWQSASFAACATGRVRRLGALAEARTSTVMELGF